MSAIRMLAAAAALVSLSPSVLAGGVNGAASFAGGYQAAQNTSSCDPNSVCDSEGRNDRFDYSRSQAFSGGWSAVGIYDPDTGAYTPGWTGSLPGTQVGIAGSPNSPAAPPAFTDIVFAASATASIGSNGASASSPNGFVGVTSSGYSQSGTASGYGNWYETVTFGGGTGTGTAHVVIQLDGEMYSDGGDAASLDTANLSYSFIASAYDPVLGYQTALYLTESRVVYGGAYDAGGQLDYCDGGTSPDCSGPFSKILEGDMSFLYGLPVQMTGSLSVSVSGAGSVDAMNAARLLAIYVPEGTSFAYETEGLGNPLNITPVPEPGPLLMILAGLGMVGLVVRRRLG
jgi:hypothetical protein